MKCEVCVFYVVVGVDFLVCTENSFEEISRSRSSWQNNPMAAAPKGEMIIRIILLTKLKLKINLK